MDRFFSIVLGIGIALLILIFIIWCLDVFDKYLTTLDYHVISLAALVFAIAGGKIAAYLHDS